MTSAKAQRGEPGIGLQYWFVCARTCRRAGTLPARTAPGECKNCTSRTHGRGTDRERCKEGASIIGTGRTSARSAQPGNSRESGFYWRSLEAPGQVNASHCVFIWFLENDCRRESFNDWGGRGCDNSVPEVVIKTAPSVDKSVWTSTWSTRLPRIQLISPRGWSNMSPGGAILMPPPLKTGTNLRHSRPPQSLNGSRAQFCKDVGRSRNNDLASSRNGSSREACRDAPSRANA